MTVSKLYIYLFIGVKWNFRIYLGEKEFLWIKRERGFRGEDKDILVWSLQVSRQGLRLNARAGVHGYGEPLKN